MRAVKSKSLSPIEFELSPGPNHDGFTLTSSMLLFPLWYPNLEAAVGYARFLSRQSGCNVRVKDAQGEQIDLIQFRVRRAGSSGERQMQGRVSLQLHASNVELRQQIAALTRLEWELLETNEREHRRFGWDLHEDLGQQLAGIAILASLLARQIQSDSPALGNELGELVGQLRDAISNTRNIARGLYPIGLENGGLSMVLEEFAGWISQAEGIPCEFIDRTQGEANYREGISNIAVTQEPTASYKAELAEPDCWQAGLPCNRLWESQAETWQHAPAVPQKAAIHLYRIAQEAVNYFLKTRQARRIVMEWDFIANSLQLSIVGEGTESGEAPLEGDSLMHHRARMIGAEIEYKQLPQRQGQAIVCQLKGIGKQGEPGLEPGLGLGQEWARVAKKP